MPLQGIIPPTNPVPAPEALRSYANGLYMADALAPSRKSSITRTATPLPMDVVEDGSCFTTARFEGRWQRFG